MTTNEYKLSQAQLRIYYRYLNDFQDSHLYLPQAIQFPRHFSRHFFRKALDWVCSHNQIVFSTYHYTYSTPYQIIQDGPAYSYQTLSLVDKSLQDTIDHLAVQRSALETLPHIHVYEIQQDSAIIIIILMHHIISDDWSLNLFTKELLTCYQALFNNKPPLVNKNYTYFDYIEDEYHKLHSHYFMPAKEYFLKEFSDCIPQIALPKKSLTTNLSFSPGRQHFSIDKELFKQLKNTAQRSKISFFSLLISIYFLTLHKVSQQNDLTLAYGIANRIQKEVSNTVGMFVNITLIRLVMDHYHDMTHLLQSVFKKSIKAFQFQDYPFNIAMKDLGLLSSHNNANTFDAMFLLQFKEKHRCTINNHIIETLDIDNPVENFNLLLVLEERNNYMHGSIKYNKNLYSDSFIQSLSQLYVAIAGYIIEKA